MSFHQAQIEDDASNTGLRREDDRLTVGFAAKNANVPHEWVAHFKKLLEQATGYAEPHVGTRLSVSHRGQARFYGLPLGELAGVIQAVERCRAETNDWYVATKVPEHEQRAMEAEGARQARAEVIKEAQRIVDEQYGKDWP